MLIPLDDHILQSLVAVLKEVRSSEDVAVEVERRCVTALLGYHLLSDPFDIAEVTGQHPHSSASYQRGVFS